METRNGGFEMLNTLFRLEEHGTTVRTELVAGLTTFLTMAYIIFVNPGILAAAGMDQGAVFVATCVSAAIGSAIMGLLANYPIAQAPGMGLNAFFAFVVVKGMGVSWEIALAAVLVSGILFLILSVLPFRAWLVNSIPRSQKMAIAAGIGLFLGFIGLKSAGIIVDSPATFVTVGKLTTLPVLFAALGFILMIALDYKRIPGAIIIGILAVTAASVAFGLSKSPDSMVSLPPSIAPTFFAFDLAGFFQLGAGVIGVLLFSFLLVDLFDTAGTLVGVAHQANLLDEKGNLPRLGPALIADSTATVAGATLGTSPVTSYIESAAGVRAGGRTGLTAVAAAGCFLLALFFSPLASAIPPFATAPAILFVACVMAKALAEVDWDDITEFLPAVMTALLMPLTFSIATGIGFGFIIYVTVKLVCGRVSEVGSAVWLIAAAFLIHFVTV
jgi:AGZA family xanthine/uracil permease-like MFS transporter